MRHLGSLVLSLLLGPIVWLLTGFGLVEYARGRANLAEVDGSTVLGVLMLIVAGAVYTVLVSARLSPIGPAFVGLVFLGLAVWNTIDRGSYLDAMPRDLFDRDYALAFPAEGFAFLLAGPLLATVLSPRRWRRHDRPIQAYGPPPGQAYGPPQPTTSPAMPSTMQPGQPGYPPQQQGTPWSPAAASTPGMPSAGSPPPGYQPNSPSGGYQPPTSGPPGYSPTSGAPSYSPPSGGPPSYSPPTSGPPGYPPPTGYSPPTDATTVLGTRSPGGSPPPPTDATTLLSGRSRHAHDETTHVTNDRTNPPDDPDLTRRM